MRHRSNVGGALKKTAVTVTVTVTVTSTLKDANLDVVSIAGASPRSTATVRDVQVGKRHWDPLSGSDAYDPVAAPGVRVQTRVVGARELSGRKRQVSAALCSNNTTQYKGSLSGTDSIGHGGHLSTQLLQMAGHGRRTANKKLTKLHWPSRKRSTKRQIVLVEPKKWRVWQKNVSGILLWTCVPHFKFVPAPLGSLI